MSSANIAVLNSLCSAINTDNKKIQADDAIIYNFESLAKGVKLLASLVVEASSSGKKTIKKADQIRMINTTKNIAIDCELLNSQGMNLPIRHWKYDE